MALETAVVSIVSWCCLTSPLLLLFCMEVVRLAIFLARSADSMSTLRFSGSVWRELTRVSLSAWKEPLKLLVMTPRLCWRPAMMSAIF